MTTKQPKWIPRPEDILPALLALAANKRRRGDKLSIEERDARQRNSDRKAGERRRLTWSRYEADRKAARPKRSKNPKGQRVIDRLVLAMTPGEWYGPGDLVKSIGAERDRNGGWCRKVCLDSGITERRKNPAWRQLDPWQYMAGAAREPQWLYRLTAKGAALRAELVELLKRNRLASRRRNAAVS